MTSQSMTVGISPERDETTTKKGIFSRYSSFGFFTKHKILSLSSLVLLFLLLFSILIHTTPSLVEEVQEAITSSFSWFYSISMNFYLIICFFLVISPMGKIRLGASNDARPEMGTFSWLSMLFSAGMGIGLFFYGVVEPLSHHLFSFGESGLLSKSLALTIFHWGLHPWACYALIGLCFAYFSFRKGKRFSIISCLSPKLGKNPHGVSCSIVKITTVVCPVIGIAISLGLGALQIAKGLEYSFGLDATFSVQIIVMISITILSTVSVVSGVSKGMKYLSVLNIVLCSLLLGFIFLSTGAFVATKEIALDVLAYIKNLPPHSLWSGSHNYKADGDVINWTTFHWSAWIAWAPFVGMFIARISKGRTIREYLLGTIIVPTILSIFWFSIIGHSAIQAVQEGTIHLTEVLRTDQAITFFVFLSQYSGGIVLYGLALVCIKLFFITSANSAALVIATAANEDGNPSIKEKIYWSVAICFVAIVLLASGGLVTMQVVSIVSSIPFAIISWFMLSNLLKELAVENRVANR